MGGENAKRPYHYPNAHAYAILAMAHWQLGEKDAARAMLAKGDSLRPKISAAHDTVDWGIHGWHGSRRGFHSTKLEQLIQPVSPTERNSNNP